MNIPINWLKEFTQLPESVDDLTNCLTMIGHMLDKISITDGETIIDVELRGNRADLFGIYGIARDVAAAFNEKLIPLKIQELPNKDESCPLIKVLQPDLLKRMSALTLTVSVGKSPDFIIKRLSQCGVASINNVVDITNYVMLETGVPLHAFDAKLLHEKKLTIREAKKHEHITTFAGDTIKLSTNDIVLTDEKIVQAIPLIGSKTSGTTLKTQEILLEAAIYNPAKVRQSGRRLQLRTEASGRLEKNISPEETLIALKRALYLMEEYAEAKLSSGLSDYYPNPQKPLKIHLSTEATSNLVGIEISSEDHRLILEALGCTVEQKHAATLEVTPPDYRTDLIQEADLIEEVVRIFGYDRIPTKLLNGELPPNQTPKHLILEDQIKSILTRLQLSEVITSVFTSYKENELYGFAKRDSAIELTNPPDPDNNLLKQTLIPNLVTTARDMLNDRVERIALFESGHTFTQTNKKYLETQSLGLVVSGHTDTQSFNKHPRQINFYDLSGIIIALFQELRMEVRMIPTSEDLPLFENPQCAEIHIKLQSGEYKKIGVLGLINQQICLHLGIEKEIFAAEIKLELLANALITEQRIYSITKKHPPVIEDFSFMVPKNMQLGEMIRTLNDLDNLIESVELIDIFDNKRALRVTYRSNNKSLSSQDIQPLRQLILNTAKQKFGAVIA